MEKRQAIAIANWVSDRTPRPLAAPLLTFDLAQEADALRDEGPWREHGHNARTLIKHGDLRLVLIALRAGAAMLEQTVDEPVAIQVMRGTLQVHVPTEELQLSPGQLISLAKRLTFSLRASEDADVLLWLGWSDP